MEQGNLGPVLTVKLFYHIRKGLSANKIGWRWCSRWDLNPDHRLRRPVFYPLNYGNVAHCRQRKHDVRPRPAGSMPKPFARGLRLLLFVLGLGPTGLHIRPPLLEFHRVRTVFGNILVVKFERNCLQALERGVLNRRWAVFNRLE